MLTCHSTITEIVMDFSFPNPKLYPLLLCHRFPRRPCEIISRWNCLINGNRSAFLKRWDVLERSILLRYGIRNSFLPLQMARRAYAVPFGEVVVSSASPTSSLETLGSHFSDMLFVAKASRPFMIISQTHFLRDCKRFLVLSVATASVVVIHMIIVFKAMGYLTTGSRNHLFVSHTDASQ